MEQYSKRQPPSPELLSQSLVPLSSAHKLPGMPSRDQADRWTRHGLLCRSTGERVYLGWCNACAGGRKKPCAHTSVEEMRRFWRKVNGG